MAHQAIKVGSHFTHIQADDLAGTVSNMLATTDANGNIGPSNVKAPAASIPCPNTFDLVTITGNGLDIKGGLTSGSHLATNVVFTDSHTWSNISIGQVI